MTVPFLMNCSHNADAWCLACTKTLGEELCTTQAHLAHTLDLLQEAQPRLLGEFHRRKAYFERDADPIGELLARIEAVLKSTRPAETAGLNPA